MQLFARTIAARVAQILAGAAIAQSRSSFLTVDSLIDLNVTESNAGKTFLVEVGNSPRMVYQGKTWTITEVFGFWALSTTTI